MTALAAHILLEWQRQMGVDEAIPESPRPMWQPVRSAEEQMREALAQIQKSGPISANTPAPPPPAATTQISGSLAEALQSAQTLAQGANSVAELITALESFDGCGLKRTAKHTVFGDGNPQAKLLLIGEAPGEDEDRMGIPFCGRSGQLLSRMFEAIGLDRSTDYYISNSIYWRPPGNRAPNTEELAMCRPFVERLIALMQPEMIVLIGGIAAKAVLQEQASVAQLRRNADLNFRSGEMAIPARVMYHPAYLLRTPSQKAAAWKDLLALQAQLVKKQ
jgi:uracil-DNA glycosylase family 4